MDTSAAWDATLPRRGDRIAGKYVVRSVLGRGATAVVYEVEHLALGTRAAMKVVRTADERLFERFRREARTTGAIRHPNVVQLYDVGHLEEGWPYLLMELLTGETLENRLSRGPLDLRTAVEIGAQLLGALGAVHSRGAVHRDVKPSNLVLEQNPAGGLGVKLIDFGICRPARDRLNPQITAHGVALGTMQYMSPEQVCGLPIDRRSDLYSCGIVLYEAITGLSPFHSVDFVDLLHAIVEGAIESPRRWRPDCPRGLELILLKAVRRAPHERWESAAEMAEALTAGG